MSFVDLESVRNLSLLGSNAPFLLMSKDTRTGSRRTQRLITAVRRVFRHKQGAQLLHKEHATNSVSSDAPALISFPAEHALWIQVYNGT